MNKEGRKCECLYVCVKEKERVRKSLREKERDKDRDRWDKTKMKKCWKNTQFHTNRERQY